MSLLSCSVIFLTKRMWIKPLARILTSIGKPFSVSDSEVFVGASIGAAIYPRDGATRSELLQHADIAMYRAKDQGRNNIQHYAEHMQARFKTRLSMETQLRRALENEDSCCTINLKLKRPPE
jgi:predicted signal transduction protein with EAL and GGDEF domain